MPHLKQFTRLLLFIVLLTSCGNDDGMRTITIVTPIGASKNTHDLSKELFNKDFINVIINPIVGNNCQQKEMFAGYKIGLQGGGDEGIVRTQVKLRMQLNPPAWATIDDALNALTNYSVLDEPITLTVPKGQEIGLGIVGTLYNPLNVGPLGFCASYAGDTTSTDNTYSVSGHVHLPPGFNGNVVPLNLFVMKTIVNTGTSMPCVNPGVPNDQQCSRHNFVRITPNIAPTIGEVSAEYLLGNGPHAKQLFKHTALSTSATPSPQIAYVPDTSPILMHYNYSGSTHNVLFTRTPGSNSFTGEGGNSNFTIEKVP